MQEYKNSLGRDANLLQQHCASIIQYCLNIINSGQLKFPRNTDWEEVQRQSVKLTITQKDTIIKKRPGYEFFPDWYYLEIHGDINTNGQQQKGHRKWELDGAKGVLVPDKPTTKIELNSETDICL